MLGSKTAVQGRSTCFYTVPCCVVPCCAVLCCAEFAVGKAAWAVLDHAPTALLYLLRREAICSRQQLCVPFNANLAI